MLRGGHGVGEERAPEDRHRGALVVEATHVAVVGRPDRRQHVQEERSHRPPDEAPIAQEARQIHVPVHVSRARAHPVVGDLPLPPSSPGRGPRPRRRSATNRSPSSRATTRSRRRGAGSLRSWPPSPPRRGPGSPGGRSRSSKRARGGRRAGRAGSRAARCSRKGSRGVARPRRPGRRARSTRGERRGHRRQDASRSGRRAFR